MAMSLATPEKTRIFQRKLYREAKAEPEYRFYLLYDKICREDILRHALNGSAWKSLETQQPMLQRCMATLLSLGPRFRRQRLAPEGATLTGKRG